MLIQVLKFNLTESGLFCVLPWFTMALSANLGGWIADTLVSRGVSITTVRKVGNCQGRVSLHPTPFFLSPPVIVKRKNLTTGVFMQSKGIVGAQLFYSPNMVVHKEKCVIDEDTTPLDLLEIGCQCEMHLCLNCILYAIIAVIWHHKTGGHSWKPITAVTGKPQVISKY
eukprot:Gb_01311 [translate_table: standard]